MGFNRKIFHNAMIFVEFYDWREEDGKIVIFDENERIFRINKSWLLNSFILAHSPEKEEIIKKENIYHICEKCCNRIPALLNYCNDCKNEKFAARPPFWFYLMICFFLGLIAAVFT